MSEAQEDRTIPEGKQSSPSLRATDGNDDWRAPARMLLRIGDAVLYVFLLLVFAVRWGFPSAIETMDIDDVVVLFLAWALYTEARWHIYRRGVTRAEKAEKRN